MSATPPPDDPYKQIAAFYDAEFAGVETDAGYFARHGSAGPALVLGCGTGRICRYLERQRRVTGLDRSEPMLEIARRRSKKATYVCADMRDFDLGTFDEIIVPNAAFNFLASRADQKRCLECCQRALESGATLTLDLPMPDFTRLAQSHTPERPAWEGIVDDQPARRTREVWRRPIAQRLEIVERYYLGEALVHTSKLLLRLVFRAEAEWLLEASGFYVDVLHGNYGDEPVDERSPRLLVRATRI